MKRLGAYNIDIENNRDFGYIWTSFFYQMYLDILNVDVDRYRLFSMTCCGNVGNVDRGVCLSRTTLEKAPTPLLKGWGLTCGLEHTNIFYWPRVLAPENRVWGSVRRQGVMRRERVRPLAPEGIGRSILPGKNRALVRRDATVCRGSGCTRYHCVFDLGSGHRKLGILS